MLKNLKFSREPILWLALVVVVGQTLIDWFDGGEFEASSWWNKVIIAVGAVVGRQLVTPSANVASTDRS